MHSLQILWTGKSAAMQGPEGISLIGGRKGAGAAWELSVAEAMRVIANKQYAFYVVANGRRADVYIARTPEGRKYLGCRADTVPAETLARLPDST